MRIKSIFCLMLSLVMAFAIAGVSSAEQVYPAGTYEATTTGHNAPITVAVTLGDDAIENIEVTNDNETIGVGKIAIEKMTRRIVDEQSLAVDTITGATITSYAILNATRMALTEAGVDVDALSVEAEKEPAQDETYTADVIVVGGGGAGLAAAISAQQNGASVVVVEKLDILGGSTNISEGALNAVDPVRQGAQGIEDSYENFITQTYEGGHQVGDMELITYMCENSMATIEWMESIGVAFRDEVGTATGALFQRSHYPTTPSGNSYIRVFEEYISEHTDAITVLTGTTATTLVTDEGEVTGVLATGKEGQSVTLNANNGVILATGGFGANKELLAQYNTGVWAHVDVTALGCTNMAQSATGAGIEMATAIGADVTGMSDIQLHPCGTPGTGLMENIRTSGRNRIFVNSDGNRFVNEGAARDTLAQAVLDQEGQTYWIVVNSVRYPSRDYVDNNGATIANMVAQGSVIEADTLEELAEKTGMSAENLISAIDNYNAIVRGELEDELGFVANNQADVEMTEGPWYACRKVATVHHTMGGLKINTDTQVIDTDGNVISGLYAAGEVTGGIHGSNRLGGNAIADCMTYGKRAGEVAAANK
ncbi:MAG: flavocytochrome c [Clostridia bacterium]|nr:flavocytochrome c [Clostridia bacterium]